MAKLTKEQSKSFFNRNTDNRGNGRELYLTPINVIEKVVSSLIIEKPFLKDRIWVDPCAADGRWQEVIEKYNIKCISFDIEPLNNKVFKADFYSTPYQKTNKYFFIGNPPYSMLKDFINISLNITDYCYFFGGSQIITGSLSNKVELLHRFEGYEGNHKDKRSKIKFFDTNNEKVAVWTCGALFTNKDFPKFKQVDSFESNTFRVSIKNYCKEDDRVKIIKE